MQMPCADWYTPPMRRALARVWLIARRFSRVPDVLNATRACLPWLRERADVAGGPTRYSVLADNSSLFIGVPESRRGTIHVLPFEIVDLYRL